MNQMANRFAAPPIAGKWLGVCRRGGEKSNVHGCSAPERSPWVYRRLAELALVRGRVAVCSTGFRMARGFDSLLELEEST